MKIRIQFSIDVNEEVLRAFWERGHTHRTFNAAAAREAIRHFVEASGTADLEQAIDEGRKAIEAKANGETP